MLPLKSDEFLASSAEGEIELSGIKLVSIDRDHPGFEKGNATSSSLPSTPREPWRHCAWARRVRFS